MALIKCPECGKEISDKATTCPNCGCPIKEDVSEVTSSAEKENVGGISESNSMTQNQMPGVKEKSKAPFIIVGALVAALLLIVLVIKVIPKKDKVEEITTEATTEDNSQEVYDEAIELIESGKYEEAKDKFETIPDYKDSATILDQIPWETRVFACVEKLKDMLKSPDSLKIYNVVIFSKNQKEDAKLEQDKIDGFKNIFDPDEEAPVIVIHYGGENTMGGMTEEIIIFVMDKQTHEYFAYGHTKTLDKDKAKDDEEDVVFLYNTMNDNFERTGDVDVDRINAIIKNGVYTNVKIIDD